MFGLRTAPSPADPQNRVRSFQFDVSSWTWSETEHLGVTLLGPRWPPEAPLKDVQRYWTEPHRVQTAADRPETFISFSEWKQIKNEKRKAINVTSGSAGPGSEQAFWCGTREGEEDREELKTETDFLFSLSGSEMSVSLVCLHWFRPRGGVQRVRTVKCFLSGRPDSSAAAGGSPAGEETYQSGQVRGGATSCNWKHHISPPVCFLCVLFIYLLSYLILCLFS